MYSTLEYLDQANEPKNYASFFFFFFLGESPEEAAAWDFSALSAFFFSFLAFRSASVSPSSYTYVQQASRDKDDR